MFQLLKNILLIFLFSFLIRIHAFAAMNAPDLRCISVSANGDVTLNWMVPAPSGEFNNYAIYRSNAKIGPYTLIHSETTYSLTTFTDIGAGANAASYFYYLKTSFGSGPTLSAGSDTLQSIFLTLANIGGGRIADLSWNPIHIPNLSSSTGLYYIYREYPVGIWTKIDSTSSLSYKDTISLVCTSTFLNYYVEIADASGCISRSCIKGDNFFDQTPPQTPLLKSVSVDTATGNVSINWYPGSSNDTKGYIIYKVVNNISIPIDTVFGIANTSYTNTNSNAGSSSETYLIAAIDSCNGTGLLGTIHKTIYTNIFLNRCNGADSLVWSKYYNIPSGVAKYNIYASINNSSFSFIGSTSATDTTFTHNGLINLNNYCYYIEVVNTDGDITSTSNKTCITANIAIPPTFLYLRKASVSGNQSVTITIQTDINADINYYKINRADNNSGPYDSIGQIAYSNNSTIIFIDNTAQTSVQSYYYTITAIDSCGNEKITSNIGRTIYLSAIADIEGGINTLNWNEYEQWSGSVSSYNIYRSTNGVFSSPIDNVVSSTANYSYPDDILNVLQGEGVFYYFIEAIEDNGNIYGFKDTSVSNTIQTTHPAFIYIPNAFTPGGNNPLFIPVSTYINKTDYLFEIFDRWGTRIFYTNDSSMGWDGTYQSGKIESGIYVYKVQFKDSFDNPLEKKGTVILIR